jgi:Uma2 family endonuclease
MNRSDVEEATMTPHDVRSRPQLALGPGDEGRALSAQEFADAIYEGLWRYEREGGRLVVMAPDGGDHQETASPWLRKLFSYWDDHPEIARFIVPNAWVRVDQGTDRIGDIGVYLAGDFDPKKIPNRVPELIFEIVSPGRRSRNRDYVKKRSDYGRLGVNEYVVVDRFKKQVTVHRLTARGYGKQVLTRGDTYTSRLLPGLAIALDEVLEP